MPYADPERVKEYQKEYRSKNRVASKVYIAEWRSRNKKRSDGYNVKWDVEIRQVNHKNLLKYLETHPCVDCGEKDPVVLQFDHIHPDAKKQSVSRLIDGSYWENALEEIEKCRVVCANCHTRRTAKQFGWWKAKGATA